MDYTESRVDCKHPCKHTATVEQIENHTEKVRKGEVVCNLPPCPVCESEPQWFKRHEKRGRQFYVIVDQIVKTVLGLLMRWKCPGCDKTFTAYPDFALPYKRYTLPTIMAYCGGYTENDRATYRDLVQKSPLGYRDDEKQLDHTTVFRWTGTLGGFAGILAKAQDLIIQAKPMSTICRDLANLSVNPKKYRSDARTQALSRCRRILGAETIFQSVFGISIFPTLATGCRYG